MCCLVHSRPDIFEKSLGQKTCELKLGKGPSINHSSQGRSAKSNVRYFWNICKIVLIWFHHSVKTQWFHEFFVFVFFWLDFLEFSGPLHQLAICLCGWQSIFFVFARFCSSMKLSNYACIRVELKLLIFMVRTGGAGFDKFLWMNFFFVWGNFYSHNQILFINAILKQWR